MGYKYVICESDSDYRFVLFPNNSNSQMIGESISYGTEDECIKGLERFRRLVKENKVDLYVEEQNNVFFPSIVTDKTILFSLERGYPYHRYECDNWIQRIKCNIDAPLRNRL